ncbi:REST corepressor [Orchesella cincta]|uniref:REST corepressor n=1 Tax=Orchesella cincta TaxID=48709 RepID=A0A1D2MBZ3_ORCCI|nr:REST corepressor [Orchesella cincta]
MEEQQKHEVLNSPPRKKLRSRKQSEDETDSSQSSVSTPVSVLYKDARIRIGEGFQAIIPKFISEKTLHAQTDAHRATQVWKPTDKLTDKEIETFVSFAKEKHMYSEEQALGLLYYRNYNLEEAKQDLANFAPSLAEELTNEEKMLFDVNILTCDGNLSHMSELFPNRHLSTIMHYYYQWKNQHGRKSRMDLAGGNSTRKEVSGQRQNLPPSASTSMNSKRCGHCRVQCEDDHKVKNLCNVCYTFWEKTGSMRDLTKILKSDKGGYKYGWKVTPKTAAAPPKGMNLNVMISR